MEGDAHRGSDKRDKDRRISAYLHVWRVSMWSGQMAASFNDIEASYRLLLGYFFVNICGLCIKRKVQLVWQSVDPLP